MARALIGNGGGDVVSVAATMWKWCIG